VTFDEPSSGGPSNEKVMRYASAPTDCTIRITSASPDGCATAAVMASPLTSGICTGLCGACAVTVPAARVIDKPIPAMPRLTLVAKLITSPTALHIIRRGMNYLHRQVHTPRHAICLRANVNGPLEHIIVVA
jgi:hypothetical protein